MREENGYSFGNMVLCDHVSLAGKIHGNVTAEAGSRVVLLGKVTGDFIVKPGAWVALRGTVGGNVFNNGGELNVSGLVEKVVHRIAGLTTIEDGAQIKCGVW